MSNRFDNLTESLVFKHLVTLLDVSTWAKNMSVHKEDAISKMIVHFNI